MQNMPEVCGDCVFAPPAVAARQHRGVRCGVFCFSFFTTGDCGGVDIMGCGIIVVEWDYWRDTLAFDMAEVRYPCYCYYYSCHHHLLPDLLKSDAHPC